MLLVLVEFSEGAIEVMCVALRLRPDILAHSVYKDFVVTENEKIMCP